MVELYTLDKGKASSMPDGSALKLGSLRELLHRQKGKRGACV